MGTDKGKERAKRWASHVERGNWGPCEKETGTDKVRVRENPWGSQEESGTEILWGRGDVPWEKPMGRGKERVREKGRN